MNLGEKMVLSMAKMMTMATPPVTMVVTMLRTPSGRLKPIGPVTGFQMQVNRFMMKNTASAPAKWQRICGTTGPLLLNVMLRCSGKLMISPIMMVAKLASVKARPPSAALLPMTLSTRGTPAMLTLMAGQPHSAVPTMPANRAGRKVSRAHLMKVTT